MRLVLALGGNALLRRDEAPDAAAQAARLAVAAPALARLAERHSVVIVHGNGPQVGLLARESTDDRALSAPYPLGALSAETQGLIGSLLTQSLRSAGLAAPVVTLVTHTIVDAADPALAEPTKFIGAVYDEHRARRLAARHGWSIARDGDGWRRVVPSPLPRRVVELAAGSALLAAGTTVIMGGGGGIPLLEEDGYRPVDAVIDKDRTAALLAESLDADRLVILTDVPGAMTDYGTPDERVIERTTPALLRALPFPGGSMGPKVAAACAFTEATGRLSAIGALEHAEEVVEGIVGTQVAGTAG